MNYKLFLDDIRKLEWVYPNENINDWIIIRSYDEFVKCISKNGIPEFISFDHDLADEHYQGQNDLGSSAKEKTGLECARWLVDFCIDRGQIFPGYKVHSSNPPGKANIIGLIEGFKKFRENSSF